MVVVVVGARFCGGETREAASGQLELKGEQRELRPFAA